MSNPVATQNTGSTSKRRKNKKGGSQSIDGPVSDNKTIEASTVTPVAAPVTPANLDGATDVKRESETLKELMK